MNRITRLTALLLAMLMIFSTFAAADTAYPVGGMTQEQWNAVVENAQKELFTTDEGDSGKVVEPPIPEVPAPGPYHPYTDGTTIPLTVSEKSVASQLTPSGVAVLTNSDAGQWQISINGVWVNITGETGDSLWVTAAMMNGLSTADFRKALGEKDTETGEYTIFTQTATVTLVESGAASWAVVNLNDGIALAAEKAVGLPVAANDVMTLEEANDKIVLTIQYVNRSNMAVASSYTASFTKGSSFTATVMHPSVVGYQPTYQAANSSNLTGVTVTPVKADGVETGVTYNFTNLQADSETIQNVTISIVYQPATVAYKVEHYWQNLDDDEYTLHETEDKTGLTEDLATASAKDYGAGFYNLLFETPTIAANGSTVVKIYYNRYYFLMNFDMGGGYGVEPIYAKYGTPVGTVSTPTRPGYSFRGWSLNGSDTVDLPTTVPAAHRDYTALWDAGNSSYTVVYWNADLDDNNATTPKTYSYWGQKTVNANSGTVLTPSVVGRNQTAASAGIVDAAYFAYDAAATAAQNKNDQTITVAGDGSTVVNVYYSRKVYEIRFLYAFDRVRSLDDYDDYNYYIYTLTGNGKVGVAIDYGTNTQEVRGVNNLPSVTGYTSAKEEVGIFTYHFISIKAEYGANIGEKWPAAAIGSTGGYAWGSWAAEFNTGYRKNDPEHANIVGSYPVMSADMILDPDESVAQRMLAWWGYNQGQNYNQYISDHTYHIYFESLDGTGDKEYKGKWYVLVDSDTFTCAHNGSTRVDPFEYAGFTCVNDTRGVDNVDLNKASDYQKNSNNYQNTNANKNAGRYDCPYGNNNKCDYCNVFYYERNEYTLSFYNYNDESDAPVDEKVKFGASISEHEPADDPEYPIGPEPDSLKFAGWYTTPECYPGTEVDWNSTMPAGDLTVYAKWETVRHTVNFYLTEDATTVYEPTGSYVDEDDMIMPWGPASFEIPHGTIIAKEYVDANLDRDSMNEADPRPPYTFDHWYYYDENGEPVAFDPVAPINRDMNLYAAWTADVLVPFRVRFVHVDENGNEIAEIADAETGSGLAGSTKTFDAKVGAELYDLSANGGTNYQVGFYPSVTRSNNVEMVIEYEDEDKTIVAEVVYTFEYYERGVMPYTVYYLAKELKEGDEGLETHKIGEDEYYIIAPTDKHEENRASVVTEAFKVVAGYMPDAYQKQLILSSDESQNVIYFFYSVDSVHAYYKMSHHFMNLDRTTYTETASEQKTGVIGETINYDPITDLPEGFSYERTGIVVSGAETPGTSAVLTEEGLEIKHYYKRNPYPYTVHYYLNGTTTKLHDDMVVEGELYGAYVTETYEDLSPAYRLVGAETQSITIGVDDGEGEPENVITFYYEEQLINIAYKVVGGGGTVSVPSENLNAVTGNAEGSVATPATNYKFVGWFTDEECTQRVTEMDGTVTSENNGTKFVPKKEAATDVLPEHYIEATFYAKFELDVGDLRIGKRVEPEGAAGDTEFEFTLTLTGADGKPLTGTYNYTVETLTTTTGEDASYAATTKSGTITLANGVYTFRLKDTEHLLIKDLPPETQFEVKETPAAGYTTFVAVDYVADRTPGDTASGKIVSGGERLVRFINIVQGTLIVIKQVEGDAAPKDAEFTFTIKLEHDDLPEDYTYTYNKYKTVLQEGESQEPIDTGSITKENNTFTLKNDECIQILGLLAGAEYTVTETPNTDYVTHVVNGPLEPTSDAPSNVAIGTIPAANTERATFYNTYQYGNLTIEKTGEMQQGETAIFQVTNADKSVTYTIPLTVNADGYASATIANLPLNSEWTVTELTDWTWRYTSKVVSASSTVTIDLDGETVTFNNELQNEQWLDHETHVKNEFNQKSSGTN